MNDASAALLALEFPSSFKLDVDAFLQLITFPPLSTFSWHHVETVLRLIH